MTTQFLPGQVWQDTDGASIQAHGGGILYDSGTYYWYGENKNRGFEFVGVSCYSSHDLYNWKNEGVVLPAVLDDSTHDLFRGNIGERPKVIRNLHTGQYVLWLHVDKPGYMRGAGALSAIRRRDRFITLEVSLRWARIAAT